MKYMKTFILFAILSVLCAGIASAGVLDMVKGAAGNVGFTVAMSAIGALIVLLGKLIPNGQIQAVVGKFGYGLGVTVTLGLSKWKWTKALWNKTIEAFVIDLIYNVPVTFCEKFISGMKSDNT